MRVAFLGAEGVPYPAAFAKITEEVGSRLVERGHEVTVYCRPRYVAQRGPYRGMNRVQIPSWDTKHLDTLSFTFLSTIDLFVHRRAEIAHYHAIGPAPLGVLPRLRGIRTVVQIHGLDWRRAKWGSLAKRYLRFGEYAAVRWADAVVAVSRGLKENLESRYHRTVQYIPQGVERFPPRRPLQLRSLNLKAGQFILYMGRLVPEKGCHHLLEAFRQIGTDLPLVIAGGAAHSDEYFNSLRTLAGESVVFLGPVDDALKQELLSHCLVYVQPSELEGLSLALLEAMSCGACVLVSDIPENLEAIEEHGATFRNCDPDDLAQKLRSLLRDRDLIGALGRRAQEYVHDRYDWDQVTDKFEELYKSLERPRVAPTAADRTRGPAA